MAKKIIPKNISNVEESTQRHEEAHKRFLSFLETTNKNLEFGTIDINTAIELGLIPNKTGKILFKTYSSSRRPEVFKRRGISKPTIKTPLVIVASSTEKDDETQRLLEELLRQIREIPNANFNKETVLAILKTKLQKIKTYASISKLSNFGVIKNRQK